jgi:hypothetical protein
MICSEISDECTAFIFRDGCIGLSRHWEKSVIYIGHFSRVILLHTFSYFRGRVRGNSANHTYRRGKKEQDCPELLGTANSKNSHFHCLNWWDKWRERGQWYASFMSAKLIFLQDTSPLFSTDTAVQSFIWQCILSYETNWESVLHSHVSVSPLSLIL